MNLLARMEAEAPPAKPDLPPPAPPGTRPAPRTQSDLAFFEDLVIAGNYDGFRIFDVSDPANPVEQSNFWCNGPQNDVTVMESAAGQVYLFQSIDTPQTSETCEGSTDTTYSATPNAWEGIRIFNITDPANPSYVDSVATDCGSHTHTLLPDAANDTAYLYVASYPLSAGGRTTAPTSFGTECTAPHAKISIVEVPLSDPTTATVHERSLNLFTRMSNFAGVPPFAGCHDIAVFTALDRAAGACFEEGQIWDVSNPENPVFLNRVRNSEEGITIDLYHSAGFTHDGKLVIFGDEAGGGVEARCREGDQDDQGSFWFHRTVGLRLLGKFKIPRAQQSNCTGHNYNVIPRDGRYVLASSWYDGGTSIVDFTNPSAAKEIAFYDVGDDPSTETVERSNVWSSYWYNGTVYANDISNGVEVYEVTHPNAQSSRTWPYLNPQTTEELIPSAGPGCTIFGSNGVDVLDGSSGADVICTYRGADEVRGLGGNDEIRSGPGDDVVFGNSGNDTITSGDGNDRLYGGSGTDNCIGGTGRDEFRSCERRIR